MKWNPPDRSRSRAVLIGTSRYDELKQVPAAANSLESMHQLLTGPLCGWPADRVTRIPEPREPGNLPDLLVELFGQAQDVALFYYVGHGQVDWKDQLCLGLAGSRLQSERRASTSLTFEDVRDALMASPASTKIVILDCCFAGTAAPGGLGLLDVMDLTRVMHSTGTYTLAAAGRAEAAWCETDDSGARPQTYFTKYLLDVVEKGIPGVGPELRLGQIFIEASDALAMDSRPVPTSWATGRAPQVIFAQNASPEKLASRGPGDSGLTLIDANQFITALTFSPDGKYLATGS